MASIHAYKGITPSGVVAKCGRTVSANLLAADHRPVTCKNCLKRMSHNAPLNRK